MLAGWSELRVTVRMHDLRVGATKCRCYAAGGDVRSVRDYVASNRGVGECMFVG